MNTNQSNAATIIKCDTLDKSRVTAKTIAMIPSDDITYTIDRKMCVGSTRTIGRILEALASPS